MRTCVRLIYITFTFLNDWLVHKISLPKLSNTKSTVVTIVVNLIVLSAIKEIKMELAHRRNLLATGGGLVSSTFAEYKCFQFSVLSLRVEKCWCLFWPGGDGEPGLGKPLSSKPGPAELENVRISHTWSSLCQIIILKSENLNWHIRHFPTLSTWFTPF